MFVAAIWVWPAIFNVVERLVQVRLSGWDRPSAIDLIFSAGDWLIYALVTPVIFRITNRWPVVRPHVRQRILIHLGFALLFCFVWATAGKALQFGLGALFAPERLSKVVSTGASPGAALARDVASWILTTLPFGMVVYTTVAGMAHAFTYFVEARDRDVQLARVSEQLTAARYATLQAQLNPHFLFNTLNTIAVFVRDGDRTGAVRIVEQLSSILRRTLGRGPSNEVQFGEEIELVDTYLAIERARFPDRLRAEIRVPQVLLRAAVPSFALQHLVENAIRHGIAKRDAGGTVTVIAARTDDSLVITVEDDGAGIGPGDVRPGHGIANTRERLAALYGADGSLEIAPRAGGGTIATLRIPYREMAREETDAAR